MNTFVKLEKDLKKCNILVNEEKGISIL